MGLRSGRGGRAASLEAVSEISGRDASVAEQESLEAALPVPAVWMRHSPRMRGPADWFRAMCDSPVDRAQRGQMRDSPPPRSTAATDLSSSASVKSARAASARCAEARRPEPTTNPEIPPDPSF